MQRVATYIRKGWPVHMNDAPPDLHPYFAFREELVIDDDIIMKGEKIVVPDRLRSDYMIQVHKGHIGSDVTKRRARDIMYWPSMASDIDNMTSVCHVCNSTKLHQQKEPLKLHPVPDSPWSIVGTDIFQWNGLHYLVVVDSFSGWFEINTIPNLLAKNHRQTQVTLCSLWHSIHRHLRQWFVVFLSRIP